MHVEFYPLVSHFSSAKHVLTNCEYKNIYNHVMILIVYLKLLEEFLYYIIKYLISDMRIFIYIYSNKDVTRDILG